MLLLLSIALAADVVGVVTLPDEGARDVRGAVAAALRAEGHEVVVGVDDLLARVPVDRPSSKRAVELVRQGEELLLAFEHARAAAVLGEAAALLEPTLSPAVIDTWTRARTLAGVAWVEAGNVDAAKEAFTSLLALHPDVVPDASLLSPAARAAFDAGRAEVTARGTGTLEVRASRADVGPLVVIDGRPRGRAPIALAGLVAGPHRVALEAPGFASALTEVNVPAGGIAQHVVALAPGPQRRALAALDADAVPPLELLATLVADAHVDALVLVKIDGDVVRVRRVGARPAGAHVDHAPIVDAGARVVAALAGPPQGDVDFTVALLGRRAPASVLPRVDAPEPPSEWWLYGAIGGGTVALLAVATAATIALWPQPAPERRLAVIVELPSP